MLTRIFLLPTALGEVPATAPADRLFCNLWIGILQALCDGAVLAIPPNSGVAPKDYMDAVSAWPTKYKPRALELLAALMKNKRFVTLPASSKTPAKISCTDPRCGAFIECASAHPEIAHLYPSICSSCPSLSTPRHRSLPGTEFFLSPHSTRLEESRSIVVGNGKWQQADFERRVLAPLLATSSHVKIYDRYVGRSAISRDKKSVRVTDSYRRCLVWIAGELKKSISPATRRTLEVYCGVTHLPLALKATLKAEASKLESDISAACGASASVILKQERGVNSMPHGRYIVTDQTAILIERGVDILWDDKEMADNGLNPSSDPRRVRDFAIVRCRDLADVDIQTRRLPDL